MSVTRSQLTGGPAYAAYNSINVQFASDSKVVFDQVWDDVETSLYGKIDKTLRDGLVKASGTPLFYDTAQIGTMFPYLSAVIGTVYPGTTDKACAWNSNNGDVVTLTSALVTRMPDLELGVSGTVLGPMEITGIIGNSDDPSAASAYFTIATGQTYANPAMPGTAVVGRQEFSAAWGSVPGFTSFQAQEKWSISHELQLTPVTIQGRTRAFRLESYRVMAKCKPLGPTMGQINAALNMQGAGVAGGLRLSTSAANLVITGSSSMSVTLGNAGLVSAGFIFGGKALRPDELGWISTLGIAAGGTPSTPALALA
ncbi:MAG: hypothetical protein ABSG59_10150 [Verrucomicrobiota bacterium]|jgi:hypothetical protein